MKHLIKARHIVLLLFISLIALLSGCIKEDISQCGVVFLFRYNNKEVRAIDLMLFTENDVLFEKHSFKVNGSKTTLRLPIPIGKYRVITWANNCATEQM